jgi:hypothetical protein
MSTFVLLHGYRFSYASLMPESLGSRPAHEHRHQVNIVPSNLMTEPKAAAAAAAVGSHHQFQRP